MFEEYPKRFDEILKKYREVTEANTHAIEKTLDGLSTQIVKYNQYIKKERFSAAKQSLVSMQECIQKLQNYFSGLKASEEIVELLKEMTGEINNARESVNINSQFPKM